MSQHDLVELATQVGVALKQQGWTLSTAESCTGGLLGHALTEVSGSSAYYLGGVIAYDNAIKQRVLSVPEPLLREHGAVSEPTAVAMAQGVQRLYGSSAAIATTGIAGPGGGSAAKPVGLVYIAVLSEGRLLVERRIWQSDRSGNKVLAARRGLELLLEMLCRQNVI